MLWTDSFRSGPLAMLRTSEAEIVASTLRPKPEPCDSTSVSTGNLSVSDVLAGVHLDLGAGDIARALAAQKIDHIGHLDGLAQTT